MPTIIIHKKLQEISKQNGYPCAVTIDKLICETGFDHVVLAAHLDVLKTLQFVKLVNDKVYLTETGWEANI